VDNTRDYARVSHSRQWSNYNFNLKLVLIFTGIVSVSRKTLGWWKMAICRKAVWLSKIPALVLRYFSRTIVLLSVDGQVVGSAYARTRLPVRTRRRPNSTGWMAVRPLSVDGRLANRTEQTRTVSTWIPTVNLWTQPVEMNMDLYARELEV